MFGRPQQGLMRLSVEFECSLLVPVHVQPRCREGALSTREACWELRGVGSSTTWDKEQEKVAKTKEAVGESAISKSELALCAYLAQALTDSR